MLLEIAQSILRQARRTVERIEILAPAWPQDRGGSAGNRDKVVNEAALFLYVADRAAQVHPALRASVDALAEVIDPAIRSHRVDALLLRRHRSAALYRMADLILRRMGRTHPTFSAAIDRSYSPRHQGSEQIAFRILETRWVEMLAGGGDPTFDDLLPFSIFSTELDVFELDRIDLYAVTHWLMYVTDFGRLPVPSQLRQPTLALLHDAIAWQLAEHDFDLLGELLLAAHFCGGAWSHPMDEIFSALVALWQRQTFLPSPGLDTTHYETLTGAEREAYAVAFTYHTQFVFGILSFCLLEHPAEPTHETAIGTRPEPIDTVAIRELARSAAQRAQAFAGPDAITVPIAGVTNSGTAWHRLSHAFAQLDVNRPVLEELDRIDPDLRTRLVLDGGLVRAARDYNLAGLAALLQLVLDDDLPATPIAWRAVAWLTRQQTEEGAIGIQWIDPVQRAKPEARIVTGTLASLLQRWSQHQA
jgi:hypothetical protein